MNKSRRQELGTLSARIADTLGTLSVENFVMDDGTETDAREDAKNELDEIKSGIESCQSDEQDYYDNMPEGIQMSERGDKAQAAIEAMSDAISDIDSALSADSFDDFETSLESAQSYLETAAE